MRSEPGRPTAFSAMTMSISLSLRPVRDPLPPTPPPVVVVGVDPSVGKVGTAMSSVLLAAEAVAEAVEEPAAATDSSSSPSSSSLPKVASSRAVWAALFSA